MGPSFIEAWLELKKSGLLGVSKEGSDIIVSGEPVLVEQVEGFLSEQPNAPRGNPQLLHYMAVAWTGLFSGD